MPDKTPKPLEELKVEDQFIELVCALNCKLMDREGRARFDHAKMMLVEDESVASANIFTAAACGHWQAVAEFLAKDKSMVNARGGPRDWTALLYLCFGHFFKDEDEASKSAMLKTAEMLLQAGADPNAYFMLGDEKETCLYGACGVVNDAQLAELLLTYGADVNDEDAAYHVAEFQNLDCVKVLLQHGLDAERAATILLRKLDFDDQAGVRTLLDLGIDANHGGFWGKTPLHQAIMRGRNDATVELLLDRGANPNAIRKDGMTAYLLACIHGRPAVEAMLRARGAAADLGETESFLAACGLGDLKGALAAIETNPQLLKQLSDLDKRIVPTAGAQGNLKALKVIVAVGFELDHSDDQGFTALHWAAWFGHLDCVRFLLEQGAPVEAKNNYGGTVLDSTVWGYANSNGDDRNCREILELLFSAGADPTAVNPFPSGHAECDQWIAAFRDAQSE